MLAKMHFNKQTKIKNIEKYISDLTNGRLIDILEEAYKNGHEEVSLLLADTYAKTPDYEKKDSNLKAFKYYKIAAKQGNTKAYYPLYEYYKYGELLRGYSNKKVETNEKEALKWIQKAAYTYPKNKLYLLMILREYEELVKKYKNNKNLKLQKKYETEVYLTASKLADLGDLEGQVLLAEAEAFEWGKGTYENQSLAFKYYYKAAINPDEWHTYLKSFARMKVGEMYYYGRGTKKDYILSYSWLNLSLSGLGKKNRQYANTLITRLERILTQSQIIYAQKFDPSKQVKQSQKKQNKSSSKGMTGTGFFVNKTNLLTNNHVVKKCKKIEIVNKNYKSEAEVIVRDSVNDLAVLKAKKTNSSFLMFRSGRSVRVGDEIVVLGYPMGMLLGSGIKLTSGNISALTGLINNTTRVQLTAPVQPGNSGGPLLDRSGNVAGVIVARLEKGLLGRNAQNVNLAIKSNIAQVFLDTNNVDYEVRISKEKKEMADIADENKEAVVQVICYE